MIIKKVYGYVYEYVYAHLYVRLYVRLFVQRMICAPLFRSIFQSQELRIITQSSHTIDTNAAMNPRPCLQSEEAVAVGHVHQLLSSGNTSHAMGSEEPGRLRTRSDPTCVYPELKRF